jgi:hypothetical protein
MTDAETWLESVREMMIQIAEQAHPLTDSQRARLRDIYQDGLQLALHESA